MESDTSVHDTLMPFKHFAAVDFADAPAVAREVPIKEAKAKLTELLRAAEAGERIILTRHGKPIADLVAHQVAREEKPMSVLERVAAWHQANPSTGAGWVSPDFDDQLPEDFLLQPIPDDFDESLAAANNRARSSRGQ